MTFAMVTIGDPPEKVAKAPVLFASLVEQEERRQAIRRNFGDLCEFAFVDCVDGRGWSAAETDAQLSEHMRALRQNAEQQGKTYLASGAIACAVTHRDNLVGNVTAPGKVLCEDDVVFKRDFLKHLADGSALSAMSETGGFVMLNYRSRIPIRARKQPVARFGRYSIHRLESDQIVSGAAYFVTPEIGQRMRAFQTPISVPIDSWCQMKQGGVFDDIYLIHPSPARTGHFPSTINYGRQKRGLKEWLRGNAFLRRLKWKLTELRGKTTTQIAEWV